MENSTRGTRTSGSGNIGDCARTQDLFRRRGNLERAARRFFPKRLKHNHRLDLR